VVTRPRSHTAINEISVEDMKDILLLAGIKFNPAVITKLLLSFDSVALLGQYVVEQLDRKESEEVQQIVMKYDIEKMVLLYEIEIRNLKRRK